MAEEFYISVSFEMDSTDDMEALETVIEHIDLCEADEARTLLSQHHLTVAQSLVEKLTTQYSDYTNQHDLINMYADTYNDSVEDFQLEINNNGLNAEISVEGWDREADDYCAALVLILIAAGANNITAKAGSAMWSAVWQSDTTGSIQLNFEEEE